MVYTVSPPFQQFTDTDGSPLENGYIWVGVANQDPQTNPAAVYWDSALTLPAAQPIRTLAGYPVNNGTPTNFYAASDYSIRVMNKSGSTIYNAPESGSPLPVTPPQFDNDTSLATTAFVQRALGSYSGFFQFTTTTTLTAAHAGAYIDFYISTAQTATLPSTVPVGTVFSITNNAASAYSLTVNVPGGIGSTIGSSAQTTYDMTKSSNVSFVHKGGGAYDAIGDSGEVVLSTNGWKKLDPRLILQWGYVGVAASTQATVTFPIAFPNQCFCVVATSNDAGVNGTNYRWNAGNWTLGNFKIANNWASGTIYGSWIAIGY